MLNPVFNLMGSQKDILWTQNAIQSTKMSSLMGTHDPDT